MERDDDLTTAEEIRLLREDQRQARRSGIIALVVALVVAAALYSTWSSRDDAKDYGDCIRERRVPIEQC